MENGQKYDEFIQKCPACKTEIQLHVGKSRYLSGIYCPSCGVMMGNCKKCIEDESVIQWCDASCCCKYANKIFYQKFIKVGIDEKTANALVRMKPGRFIMIHSKNLDIPKILEIMGAGYRFYMCKKTTIEFDIFDDIYYGYYLIKRKGEDLILLDEYY